MKKTFITFIASMVFFSCSNTKAVQTNDFIGYYETTIGAASTPGRLISLQIKNDKQAYFSIDYLNSSPEFVDTFICKNNNEKIELHCINNSCDEETMIFQMEENNLVYLGNSYGENSLVLEKKEQPKPSNKKLYAFIKKENDTTFVSYGGKTIRWRLFNKPIEKLEIQEGEFYTIWMLRKPIKNGNFSYEFLEFVEEEE